MSIEQKASDLISREAAVALLNKIPIDHKNCPRDKALNEAIEALTNMPSASTLATNEINALKDALAQAERVTLDDMDDDDLQWWLENRD